MKMPLNKMIIGLIALQSTLAFAFGIEAKGILKTYGQPIHELITEKAAFESGFLRADQAEELKHLIEGVRFNDDPQGYLLPGSQPNGGNGVLAFALEFIGGKGRKDDPTKAAHFGDYQFLHAMGKSSLTPEKIKEKIILYIYHCLRAATEPDSFARFVKDYDAVAAQAANPDSDFRYTRDQLIVRRASLLFPPQVLFFHATNQIEFQYRALGSILHVIQDSYAKGHVVRTGWDTENSGKIHYFQDYSEQDSHEHSALDNHHGRVTINNVLEVPGSKAAFERSKQWLTMVATECPWTSAQLVNHPACTQSLFSLLNNDIFAFENEVGNDSRATHSHPDLKFKPIDHNNFEGGG